MANIKNITGFRRCYLCDKTHPATFEFFPKDKNRPLGLGYQCKPCALAASRKRAKPRPLRWSEMTDEQRQAKVEHTKHYSRTKGKIICRVASYRKFDKARSLMFDLDTSWFEANIFGKPCFYCNEPDSTGCDRVNNAFGHLRTNVVPCCRLCNTTRMDNFSHREMLLIGSVIRGIRDSRIKDAL